MKQSVYLFRFFIVGSLMVCAFLLNAQSKEETMDIRRIWDRGEHNAYTDINYFKNKLLVVFREADNDIPNDKSDYGKIRVLQSLDGEFWESATLIELPGVDLRNPTISITPKKRIMVLMKGVQYEGGENVKQTSYISLSDPNGNRFSEPEPLELEAPLSSEKNCLWRFNWYDKTGFGVFTQTNSDGDKSFLVQNEKKKELEVITELDLPNGAEDITIRFLSGAEMMIIAKTNDTEGIIGTSKSPYKEWNWQTIEMSLEGANFEIIPINKILLGTTLTGDNGSYAALLTGKKGESFHESFQLPSGGDTGHMGMFAIAGYVWLSYHSSHEGKTSVYYAKIPFSKLQ